MTDAGDGNDSDHADRADARLTCTMTPGLRGEYFNNLTLSGPGVVRQAASLNFDWGTASPLTGIGADLFSARWTGWITAPSSGSYTLYTTSDDGVRLWVGGQQIINNWTNHAPTTNAGQIALSAGQAASVRLEYDENTGGAVMKLEWVGPNLTGEVVPSSGLSLIGGGAVTPPPPPAGCTSRPCVTGQWSAIRSWPMLVIHATLMPDGTIKPWGWRNSDNKGYVARADPWNPNADIHTTLTEVGNDIFGTGHDLTEDGKLFVAGGSDPAPNGPASPTCGFTKKNTVPDGGRDKNTAGDAICAIIAVVLLEPGQNSASFSRRHFGARCVLASIQPTRRLS